VSAAAAGTPPATRNAIVTPNVSATQPISGPPMACPAEKTMIHSETTLPRMVARAES
jgi:hypothetical protein